VVQACCRRVAGVVQACCRRVAGVVQAAHAGTPVLQVSGLGFRV